MNKSDDKRTRNFFKINAWSNKKGQIFLVCTVIMTIYMLSFINIIYELNEKQFSYSPETTELEELYDNFIMETEDLLENLLINYTQPTSTMDEAAATQYLQNWLDFIEARFIRRGYLAVIEIDPVNSLDLSSGNSYESIECYLNIYLESNYLTIETQLQSKFNYSLIYTPNPGVDASVTFFYETLTERFYIGYGSVAINGQPTTDYFNGTYYYNLPPPAPGSATIVCVAPNQLTLAAVY
ncbi:MAG: hypothetical protein GF308_04390 [Candidatus Heimdallarchaeota archaeon]|nr:hypothetical protein [Candidatus Heimdallarchaeota archaeon]